MVPEFQSISPWVWVRPDLNRSRQHPKLVGFPVGRMTRGPRAQTKLPHGPAGDSNRLAATNLIRTVDHPGFHIDGRGQSISSPQTATA